MSLSPACEVTLLPPEAAEAIREFYDRWSAAASPGRLPTLHSMEPDVLFARFPGCALIEIERRPDGGRRYVFRKTGRHLREKMTRPPEGRGLEDIVRSQVYPDVALVYDMVVDRGPPHYWHRTLAWPGMQPRSYERIIAPTAADGLHVDALLGVWVWHSESGAVETG